MARQEPRPPRFDNPNSPVVQSARTFCHWPVRQPVRIGMKCRNVKSLRYELHCTCIMKRILIREGIMKAVSIRHVTKTFGKHVAVDDLSLEVPAGKVYGFIGPNGSGKTTTLRMIMRILHP